MQPYIRIQNEDFSQAEQYASLASGNEAGAVVTFVGRVREFAGQTNQRLWLEHYAGMTEKVLLKRIDQACLRWSLLGVRIVHRVGHMLPGEQIVFVGVSAAHRKEAFHACEYLMDYLKNEAPFWKREGDQWMAAKMADQHAVKAWEPDA